MNDEAKQEKGEQAKREDIVFISPNGPNEKTICITIQRPQMMVNGTTQNAVYRRIKPSKGVYRLHANALYYDEEKRALEEFAERHGLKRIRDVKQFDKGIKPSTV